PEAPLEPCVRPEIGVEGLLPRRVHDHHARDPGRGHLRDDELDDRGVADRQKLFRHRPADREKARSEPARRDDAVAHRLLARAAVALGRFSALTLNAIGSVVRTANPVTATRAGRAPDVSTSKLSAPLSTIRGSTVARAAAKLRNWN